MVRLTWAKRAIPIYLSAEGPRTLELAGEIADGVIVNVGLIAHATITHIITAMRLLSLFIGSNPPVPRSFPPGYSHANQAGPETHSRQGMPPGDRAGGRRQNTREPVIGSICGQRHRGKVTQPITGNRGHHDLEQLSGCADTHVSRRRRSTRRSRRGS